VAGAQIQAATLPAGAMPANGLLHVNTTPSPAEALASLAWGSTTAATGSRTSLSQHCALTAGGTTASSGFVDVRLALTAPAPLLVSLQADKGIEVTAGLPAPMLRVDVGDDGTFELTEGLGLQIQTNVLLGPIPFHVRVQMDAGTTIPGTITSFVTIDLLPTNTNVSAVVSGCAWLVHGVAPRFDGNLDLSFDSPLQPLQPGVVVLGLAPQPVLLGMLPNAACLLMPSPDLLVLTLPGTTLTLNVPPAARPVTIWTQAVGLQFGGLVTSNGLRVDAL
jgi:hypothetical protein